MKFGLQGIEALLEFLGNPEKKFYSIHIAGTNGKGSTASMIAAMYMAAGYKTGLYTSPHLVSMNERIRINGKPITSRTIARLASKIQPEVVTQKCTFFEAITAIAFQHFAESHVDIAVVETGLGGRLDATNVLQPLASVITTIGLEHTHILGSSIQKIAFEKGGIIKEDVPCLTGARSPDAIRVIKKICERKKSQLIRIDQKSVKIKQSSIQGLRVDISLKNKFMKNVEISLTGEHQASNACLAINTIETVARRSHFKIGSKQVREGLRKIQEYSGIYGRLSVIKHKPLILADVAHNPDAILTLVSSLQKLLIHKVHLLFGLMKDKDFVQIIQHLQKIIQDVFVVEARTDRAIPSRKLAKEFRKYSSEVSEFVGVKSGLMKVLQKRDGIPIVITGSHFVVGEVLAILKKEKYLTINQ